jgi:hypothetical protein
MERNDFYTNQQERSIDQFALSGIEEMLTDALRTLPIGSRKARQLYGLRDRVRKLLAINDVTEHVGSAVHPGLPEMAIERMAGDAA